MYAYANGLWDEWVCLSDELSCPCGYPSQPLLRLRGVCKNSLIEKGLTDKLFSPKHLLGNPGNMILLGQLSTRVEYNDTTSQWILTDAKYDVTAMSRATKLSYLLGKHDWTLSSGQSRTMTINVEKENPTQPY